VALNADEERLKHGGTAERYLVKPRLDRARKDGSVAVAAAEDSQATEDDSHL